MNTERYKKISYASGLLTCFLYSDDVDVQQVIRYLYSLNVETLTCDQVDEIRKLINDELDKDIAKLENFDKYTQYNFINGFYIEGIDVPSVFYYDEDQEEEKTECQHDWMFQSHYNFDTLKFIREKYKKEINSYYFTEDEEFEVICFIQSNYEEDEYERNKGKEIVNQYPSYEQVSDEQDYDEPNYKKDNFYALTDGQEGDYEDFLSKGDDIDDLIDGLVY